MNQLTPLCPKLLDRFSQKATNLWGLINTSFLRHLTRSYEDVLNKEKLEYVYGRKMKEDQARSYYITCENKTA